MGGNRSEQAWERRSQSHCPGPLTNRSSQCPRPKAGWRGGLFVYLNSVHVNWAICVSLQTNAWYYPIYHAHCILHVRLQLFPMLGYVLITTNGIPTVICETLVKSIALLTSVPVLLKYTAESTQVLQQLWNDFYVSRNSAPKCDFPPKWLDFLVYTRLSVKTSFFQHDYYNAALSIRVNAEMDGHRI